MRRKPRGEESLTRTKGKGGGSEKCSPCFSEYDILSADIPSADILSALLSPSEKSRNRYTLLALDYAPAAIYHQVSKDTSLVIRLNA